MVLISNLSVSKCKVLDKQPFHRYHKRGHLTFSNAVECSKPEPIPCLLAIQHYFLILWLPPWGLPSQGVETKSCSRQLPMSQAEPLAWGLGRGSAGVLAIGFPKCLFLSCCLVSQGPERIPNTYILLVQNYLVLVLVVVDQNLPKRKHKISANKMSWKRIYW